MFVFTDYKAGLKSLNKGFDVFETKKKKKSRKLGIMKSPSLLNTKGWEI